MNVTIQDLNRIGVYKDNIKRFAREKLYIQGNGTLSITIATDTVTGVGTYFTSDDVGKYIRTQEGQLRTITAYVSATVITVNSIWTATESDSNFFLKENQDAEFELWLQNIVMDMQNFIISITGPGDYQTAVEESEYNEQDGTITVANGSLIITGTDTDFLTSWIKGWIKTDGDQERQIFQVQTAEKIFVNATPFSADETDVTFELKKVTGIQQALIYFVAWQMIEIDDNDNDGYEVTAIRQVDYKRKRRNSDYYYSEGESILVRLKYDVNNGYEESLFC